MPATSLAMLTAIVLLVLTVTVNALLLQLGARWAKTPRLGFGRAAGAVLLLNGAASLVYVACLAPPGTSDACELALAATQFVVTLAVSWAIVRWMLRTTLAKAILAWLPTLAAVPFAYALMLFVVHPFLFEGYAVVANSMAPALLGQHCRGSCTGCGGTVFASPPRDPRFGPPESHQLGICGDCLKTCEIPVQGVPPHTADRFLACKFLKPRRWDMVVFRLPEDPQVNYVKRLVGLPREELEIRDGDVWIDGVRLEKPPEIAGLEYLREIEHVPAVSCWAGPLRLGPDEYFVLGDFSARSKDSRLWETGAPGHPPYAVPRSHMLGVVTHVYWPPSRWRVFR